jgi:hypothetical protein
VWTFDDNPEAPSLSYGTPESNDVVIAFACDPAAKRTTIVKGAPNPRLFTLKAGPALTIEVAGAKETIPLGAATAHIPNFEKLCFGRR